MIDHTQHGYWGRALVSVTGPGTALELEDWHRAGGRANGHASGRWVGPAEQEPLRRVVEAVGHLLGECVDPPSSLVVRNGRVTVEITWPDRAAPVAAGPGTPQPGPQPADADASAPPGAPPAARPDGHVVRASTVGVFYHAAGPEQEPFVRVGDAVVDGQQIGVLEAMKLFIPVESDAAGTVVAVLAGDGEPVEYDQPLVELAAPAVSGPR